MADQRRKKYPEQGWGQALPSYLKKTIEGRWPAVIDRLQPGDFVVLGFGHNDQKDDDESRYAAPWTDYRANLERMVDDIRRANARPILVTSIYRRAFREDGQPKATLGDYPEVTRVVAKAKAVPLVDLNLLTRRMLVETGIEGSAELYRQVAPDKYANLPEGRSDNTHLQRRGALKVAGLFVEEAKRQKPALAAYLKPESATRKMTVIPIANSLIIKETS